MIKRRLILPITLAVAASITVVSAAANPVNKDADFKPEVAEHRKQILSEKLEEGLISQEKYEQIMEAIESGEFGGPWAGKGYAGGWNNEYAGEWTEEQKAEWLDKMKEILSDKLEEGVLSQEKYDKIIEAMESGEFRGFRGYGRYWNQDDSSDGTTNEQESGWKNHSGFRGFRGFRGRHGFSEKQSE